MCPTPRAALALLLAAAVLPAHADGHRRGVAPPPLVAQECGSCHVVYPPGLLPAASWQALMGGLARHFGSDASVDAPAAREIGAWLVAHAAGGRRAGDVPPDHRITRSAWFVREHREVGSAVWARAAVRSAANCGACHGGAAQGDFDEHAVHIPR